jgi:hypothetical protein
MNGSPRAVAWAWRAVWLVALGIGAWLATTAQYRSDDFGLVREAWASGDLGSAVAHWWQQHTAPRDHDAWPKFYRPVWHATFLLDAHLFGANAALSAALSWGLHVANVGLVTLLARRLFGAGWWPLVAAVICLLPGAALQAPTWIAARGQALTTTGTLAAIALATAPNLSGWRRAMATSLAVLVAAGAHDFGAMAGPLATFAAWLHRRAAVARPDAPTLALPTLVASGWIVWRASRLGDWVGGYESSTAAAATAWRMFDTLCRGTGALVLPGDGAPAVVLWLGAFVLLALLAASLLPHRGRNAARIAAAIVVLSLAPAIGTTFGEAGGVNGRYLYTAHCAWALAIPALLVALDHGHLRRIANGITIAVVGTAAIGFAGTALDLHRSLATTKALFAAIDRLPTRSAILLGLPDTDGQHLIGRNALPAALDPPFRASLPHVLGWATDFDLENGFVLGPVAALDQTPAASVWHWNTTNHTFGLDAPRPAETPTSRPRRPQLVPPNVAADRTWTYHGRPGDAVVLLAGEQPGALTLGASGQLGVVQAQRLPIGVADAAGTLQFDLPAAAATTSRLQATALRGFGPAVFFTDVVVRDGEHRR